MTKRRLGTLCLLVIGAVLVLTSCGGGSKRLTKEQFAAKANTLCAAFNKQVNAVPTPKTIAEAATSFEKLLPLDRKLVADMKALKPPANEEKAVNQAIALGEDQANRADALIAALKKNDLTKVNALIKEGNTNTAKSKPLFTQIGATECAK
jgi:hypothetical protein